MAVQYEGDLTPDSRCASFIAWLGSSYPPRFDGTPSGHCGSFPLELDAALNPQRPLAGDSPFLGFVVGYAHPDLTH